MSRAGFAFPLVLLGCSSPAQPAIDSPPQAAGAERPAEAAEPRARAWAPPPAGAVLDGGVGVYVQSCVDPACPELLHAQGEEHCDALTLADLAWRLPTRQEAQRFGQLEGLAQADRFHWTSTAFEEDSSQRWIVDPGGQSTTVPPMRKPFVIRCVATASR